MEAWVSELRYLNTIKPFICLIPSIFAIAAIIAKIVKQSKYQLKHNRQNFINSFRIAAVLFLQVLLNTFLCLLEISNNGLLVILFHYKINWKNTSLFWLDENWGLSDIINNQMAKQFRVFIESILVLSIMTGYRENLLQFFKLIYRFGRKPRVGVANLREQFSLRNSSVVVLH